MKHFYKPWCRCRECVALTASRKTTTDSAEGDVRRAATQFAQQPDDTQEDR